MNELLEQMYEQLQEKKKELDKLMEDAYSNHSEIDELQEEINQIIKDIREMTFISGN